MNNEHSNQSDTKKASHSAGVVIRIDLLQDIRDLLDTVSNEYKECKELRDKLDNLYPFLNQ